MPCKWQPVAPVCSKYKRATQVKLRKDLLPGSKYILKWHFKITQNTNNRLLGLTAQTAGLVKNIQALSILFEKHQ